MRRAVSADLHPSLVRSGLRNDGQIRRCRLTCRRQLRFRQDESHLNTTALGTNPPQTQVILMVRFRGPDGEAWNAVGGGATSEEAIAFARDSCPPGVDWQPWSWDDLYGE